MPHKTGGGNGKKHHEPQAVSDAQLREAAKLLAVAESQLANTHPKVRTQIQAAIGELNIALKIR